MFPIEHLEIIAGAVLVVAAVGTVVVSLVTAITFLVFRERPQQLPATAAVPTVRPVEDRQSGGVPAVFVN